MNSCPEFLLKNAGGKQEYIIVQDDTDFLAEIKHKSKNRQEKDQFHSFRWATVNKNNIRISQHL